MARLFIVLAALSAMFVSPSATSSEMIVGMTENCRPLDAPRSAGMGKSQEPIYYKNEAGEADDALAIKNIDSYPSSVKTPTPHPGCYIAKVAVIHNPYNEPIPVKGMKWHRFITDEDGVKIPLTAEALEDFVTVKTEGKIKICRRPGIVNAANKTNLGVPASVHYVKIENDKIVFDLALTEGVLLGPQPKCAIVGAKLDSWSGTGVQVTTNSGELKPSGSMGSGSAAYWTDTRATVVEDFK